MVMGKTMITLENIKEFTERRGDTSLTQLQEVGITGWDSEPTSIASHYQDYSKIRYRVIWSEILL
jgi:hypothetical protein